MCVECVYAECVYVSVYVHFVCICVWGVYVYGCVLMCVLCVKCVLCVLCMCVLCVYVNVSMCVECVYVEYICVCVCVFREEGQGWDTFPKRLANFLTFWPSNKHPLR